LRVRVSEKRHEPSIVNGKDRVVVKSRRRYQRSDLSFLDTLPDALGTFGHFHSRREPSVLEFLHRSMLEVSG
jgi:hypothetical protein